MAVYDPLQVYQRTAISGGKQENHMPYMLVGNCVHKKNADGSTGAAIKCHGSRQEALAHMRALYANVPDAKSYAEEDEWGTQRWNQYPYSKWFKDPKKPYGDVAYADPGYQADGKKRYPIDSEEHCRAAWSYINQQGNASKYSSGQLASIKGRIRAALKRYGVQVSA